MKVCLPFCIRFLGWVGLFGVIAADRGLHAQHLRSYAVARLPACLGESSGLVAGMTTGHWWSLNDGGNAPELICFDEDGKVLRKVLVTGAQNVDWEELTSDGKGYAYIGDFGNNGNLRRDLVIYRITHPDLVQGDSLTAQRITFSYPDQHAFPPASSGRYFDLEAMVVLGDSIHLFTKNRTLPFDGWVRHYALPSKPGSYVAARIDSFQTGGKNWLRGSVTGAALNPELNGLMLIGYRRAWVFEGFHGADFFSGKQTTYRLRGCQREAVCWMGGNLAYFTDERVMPVRVGKLFKATLPKK